MNPERFFVITPIGHVEAKPYGKVTPADLCAAAVLTEEQARALLARLKELLEN